MKRSWKRIKRNAAVLITEQLCDAIELLGRCAVLALGAAYMLFPGKPEHWAPLGDDHE